MPVPTEPERAPATAPAEGNPPSPGGVESSSSDGATSPLSLSDPQSLEGSGGKPTKIFVGGLSWQTSGEKLKEFFETNYGEVTECHIMKDQVTKRSRGFGFVTFKDAESVDKVLDAHAEEPIYIDEKPIEPKIAVPPRKVTNRVNVKRIFVGGLSSDTTEDDLSKYFMEFGMVMDAQLMYDRNTNRHRGFGFVSFDSEKPAEKACSIQFHDICGKKVEVKVAQTKEQMQCKGRVMTGRPFAPNYGYPVASYGPYYHGNYPFDISMGYIPGPMVYPNMKLRGRGGRPVDYTGPTFYGSYIDHRGHGMGYYPPGSYGNIMPPQIMRGQQFMEPSHMMPGVDYIGEQFQGMTLGGGYGNGTHSPPYSQNITTFDPNGTTSAGGSFSPTHSHTHTHTVSPSGNGTTVNGYSQVPAYTGSPPNSYAVSY